MRFACNCSIMQASRIVCVNKRSLYAKRRANYKLFLKIKLDHDTFFVAGIGTAWRLGLSWALSRCQQLGTGFMAFFQCNIMSSFTMSLPCILSGAVVKEQFHNLRVVAQRCHMKCRHAPLVVLVNKSTKHELCSNHAFTLPVPYLD